ncbi:reverse transcriptase domain-containing protein [Tanacetum coccineum]
MSFGLKNERATYQRLVDKVFNRQIGRNLEAYVDDMVIKSTSEKEMLKDIQETFKRFQSINMKLNPKKCSFDVEDGPFLGKPKEVLDSSSKWRLYTDGASNSDGSGAGLMLIDPEGLWIAQEMESGNTPGLPTSGKPDKREVAKAIQLKESDLSHPETPNMMTTNLVPKGNLLIQVAQYICP